MFASLRSRLLISYIVVVGFVLGVVGIGLLVYIIRNPYIDRQMYARLDQIADVIYQRKILSNAGKAQRLAILQRFGNEQGIRILVLSPNGEVVLDTEDDSNLQFGLRSFMVNQSRRGIALDRDDVPWLFVWRPLDDGGYFVIASMRPSRIHFLFSQRLREILRDDLLPPLTRVGLVALGLALILAFWISNWISGPLKRISNAADDMASGKYIKVQIQGPKEVVSLAEAFNLMIERVNVSQQSQEDFIANVSHELKTPLTSIQGFAQAISDGTANTPKEITKAVSVIQTEASRMTRMVMDLLDLTRLDSGLLELDCSPVNIDALLQGVVDKLVPQAADAGVDLIYQRSSIPEIEGDGDRIMQVLSNLMVNAIKNTPKGGSVFVDAASESTDLVITVKDMGVGIETGDIERIFERFYQVDKSRSGGIGRGSGLGLSIAKEIVQAHGGIITVESQPGKGSVFKVKFPLPNRMVPP